MLRPDSIRGAMDVMLFRDGIKPMWEDEANRAGGKITFKVRKGVANPLWENLVLALIGETMAHNEDICGAVLSLRFHDDSLSLWHRKWDDEVAVNALR
jgi:translation initiation factor 4E